MYYTRKKDIPSAVSRCQRYSPKDPRLRSTHFKPTFIGDNNTTTQQRNIRSPVVTSQEPQ